MLESEIKEALLKMETAIQGADAVGIRESIAFLDQTLSERRREIDAQLKHYLKNRSYMKALAYLQGETDIPKGRCGGRTDFS